ncbi:hypothetical protein PBI_POCKET_29 [Microbacterium phage Pocket]|uniref:Uncharacterized protein n=15 Tax=Ilzatvirus TaxID=2560150 RepID=A0A7T0Q572_9CAUD|nr:hypothetical protein H3N90_gp30 [Microbacterium phage Teagan]AUX82928.1 hypothetical protein PBI_KALE_29 [Microbacterium phage Kale]AUX83054.1 hypothetical protein PBI_LUDGATE_30 [Microbacterium phage Ludgate]AVJ49231.1 hypothetical protein PBI_BONINO_29 [Microbacterium phage Bonino]AVJ50502.1 hypothetical protein PBI_NATTLES_29 [Microbacterium phage Nattles]AVO25207.1 hypothetical protein PBI_GELO_29 [Microbacterium phage Gelo]AVR56052.1 hypothetical protein PBI_BANDIK_30 [Microbacterium 
MSVTLNQLLKMSPEQREGRLRGIDEPTRVKLLMQCNEIIAALVNEELRQHRS